MRTLISGADIAMANLESAVLVNAPYHAQGFTFTADSTLLDGVDGAGFDYLSLANNHSRNGGSRGILTAIDELNARGIANAGAGADEDAAAKPAYLDVNGIRLAIISCDRIAGSYWAMRGRVGTESCKLGRVTETIRAARQQADVVIVFPHWGIEYNPNPVGYQRALAAEWIAAGADMVIGAHSHVAGAMEDIDGHVVFYSMGNFVFDQDFRQSTMQGVVPELTFNGSQLVQIQLHATLIIDAQPNLVGTEDASFVIDQMHDASQGLLPY